MTAASVAPPSRPAAPSRQGEALTAAISAGSLLGGFAVADLTGVRPLGGVVLVAGFAWCARNWWSDGGPRQAAALVGTGVGAFVLAHVLALGAGWPAYPSVLVVAAADAAVVVAVGSGRRRVPHPIE